MKKLIWKNQKSYVILDISSCSLLTTLNNVLILSVILEKADSASYKVCS